MRSLSICLYGGASDNIPKHYVETVESLGREMAKRGHALIYGGGASGMMGAAARGVTSQGGFVIGVVPKFLNVFEPIYEECSAKIKTETMACRKEVMEENGDAFIVAPGGIGTFDEFFQVLTLKELGRHDHPVILFNFDGYYDSLVRVIDECIGVGFIRARVRELFDVCDTIDEVLDTIEAKVQ